MLGNRGRAMWQGAAQMRRHLLAAEKHLDGLLGDASLDLLRFLRHLYENAPQISIAGKLARRFAAMIRSDDDAGLKQWIADATNSALASLAAGIGRDLEAVRAAITQPWSTSPVEGQINRLKTIKRQMYERAAYPLLRRRLLAAA